MGGLTEGGSMGTNARCSISKAAGVYPERVRYDFGI
jgi:hypothetical protein